MTLNTLKIIDIGGYLNNVFRDSEIKTSALVIYVDNADELKKIDEDLYFRNNPTADSKEFKPSNEEIIINFDFVDIIIKIKDEKKQEETEKE